MIGIVGLFIANKAIFLHAHKFADGTTIEHAHPYDKSNFRTSNLVVGIENNGAWLKDKKLGYFDYR